MNATECMQSIELAALADNTLCISGPPGIGKTSITEQYASTKGNDFFYGVFNAATANLADTIGFLLPKDVEYHNAQGGKIVVSHGQYTYPHFFADRKTKKPAFLFTKGVLCIEEYGQATADVKRALATLVQEHRVGDYQLPKGFHIVILTNRTSDRSGVSRDFDFVINRRVDIEFTPELDAWLEWADKNDVDVDVRAFAARNPTIVFSGAVPEKQGPWCTPRSLVAAGRTMKAAVTLGMDIDSNVLIGNLQGSMGGTAIQLLSFLKLKDKLPKLSAILADPEGTAVPDTPDAQMVIAFQLADRVMKENVSAIVKYMQRFPIPFAVTFIKTMLRKSPELINTAAIGDWTRANAQLLAAVRR